MRPAAAIALTVILAGSAGKAAGCPWRGTRTFARMADLPAGAAQALGFAMADRGARFQATDVILPGPRLPSARFISARLDACTLTVRYERGGIAHTFNRAVLELREGRWMLVSRQ